MTAPVEIRFAPAMPESAALDHPGRIVVLVGPDGALDPVARKLDRRMRGALARAVASADFAALKEAQSLDLAYPAGLSCKAVQILRLGRKAEALVARRAGGAIGKALGAEGALVLAGSHPKAAEIALGLALRAYDFDLYKTPAKAPETAPDASSDRPVRKRGPVDFCCRAPEALAAQAAPMAALAEGVFFTRDLVNEPANVLTTDDFAARLAAMQELGLEVEILEEEALEALGMRALLAVGQGSDSPSKVVVMRWQGAGDADGNAAGAPLALVGKGVCFDSGGLSIKPAAGMEEMTMDMGGAAVVAGVMRTLALRKARANVVGLVGLVENMPDGRAQRPGDIVASMKGDRIEVVNTDAEGRLVLADVLWYAQERFAPAAVIDLATLTGAVIIALGHDFAGVFGNDEALAEAFLAAATAEGEGAWRLPLGEGYRNQIKSRLADVKNTGGRPAGAATAAEFLHRFLRPGTPWLHLDIAGVTLPPGETALAPKGASGWGVMALDRLIRDRFEQG